MVKKLVLLLLLVIGILFSPVAIEANPPAPYLVKDINPSGNGVQSGFAPFTYQGKAWVVANDGTTINEWWVSDGTTEGTLPSEIVSKMSDTYIINGFNPFVFNGIAYFTASQTGSGSELWRTDGTANSTWQVTHLGVGNGVFRYLGAFNGWVYLFASVNSLYGIYKTDGSIDTMQLVSPVNCAESGDIESLNGSLIFTRRCSLSLSLWKVDQNGQNLTEIKDFGYEYGYGKMVKMGNLVYINQDGIWQSDGTPEGTVQIVDDPSTNNLSVMNGWLYYATGGIASNQCVKRTQTGEEQVLICFTSLSADIIQRMIPAGDRVYFMSSGEDKNLPEKWWVTDGSIAGTYALPTGDCGVSTDTYGITNTVGSQVFFGACDSIHGRELWKSDGTITGTQMVADLNPGSDSSNPSGFILVGSRLYFSAYDDTHGRELWALDLNNQQIFIPVVEK